MSFSEQSSFRENLPDSNFEIMFFSGDWVFTAHVGLSILKCLPIRLILLWGIIMQGVHIHKHTYIQTYKHIII